MEDISLGYYAEAKKNLEMEIKLLKERIAELEKEEFQNKFDDYRWSKTN